ncbi:MAG TPA: hypothetical protein V6C78_34670 [Crinalium sp.]|jgi:hypothetical protein
MENREISLAQANLKLALWHAEAESVKSSDVYAQIQELGLPEEVVSRLHELLTFTKKVAGKIFVVGKIILLKILEFVKAHPFLVIGSSIGAVVGTAIASLIISVPFLGPLLAPVALLLKVSITGIGAVVGHRLDKQFQGVGDDLIEVSQLFFALLSRILNTVFPNTITD